MEKQTVAQDGTKLCYRVDGTSGPWLVLANGLGADLSVWDELCDYLGPSHRLLRWNYRGLYDDDTRSQLPLAPTQAVETLASDLLTLLEAEGIHNGAWIGWSLGTQVLIEALRRQPPSKPDGLVLITPCYGHRASSTSFVRNAGPIVLEALKKTQKAWEPVIKKASRWPETPSWLKRTGLVGASADLARVAQATSMLQRIHWDRYLELLDAMSRHRIDGYLPTIDIPTLAILAKHDMVTKLKLSEPLIRQIPGVEVFAIHNATHFALLEYPELINLRIEKFLRENEIR